jgi:exosortase
MAEAGNDAGRLAPRSPGHEGGASVAAATPAPVRAAAAGRVRPVAPSPERLAAQRRAALLFGAAALAATAIFGPILYYMVEHWNAVADYSHGFLVAPLAAYFAWERRRDLRRVAIDPSWWGVVPLALGTAALTVGRLGTELTSMRGAYVLTLMGLVLLLLGKSAFRVLLFPLAFLFLMVPLPQSLVNVVAFPLQLTAADWAVQVLYLLRIPALREGNIIHLPETQLFVADACSGLRSLMALITLAIVFAYFFRRNWAQRIVIVASAIPIAIVINALRVAATGILTYNFGQKAAEGVLHELQGMITFGGAFLLLLAEAWLLSRIWPDTPRPRKTVENPT